MGVTNPAINLLMKIFVKTYKIISPVTRQDVVLEQLSPHIVSFIVAAIAIIIIITNNE